jgi:phosphinothricin acetyltransferase
MKPFLIRDSSAGDMPTISAIYAHWVTQGLASFEIEPPEATQMARHRDAALAGGFPYFVAEAPEGVPGYAYASTYRIRPAYRFSVEKSVYVAPGAGRRWIGLALMEEGFTRCLAAGFRQMIAVFGDSGNAASIALHRRAGITQAGLLLAAGWKHGRWVDSVLMQRPLGDGAATPPENS